MLELKITILLFQTFKCLLCATYDRRPRECSENNTDRILCFNNLSYSPVDIAHYKLPKWLSSKCLFKSALQGEGTEKVTKITVHIKQGFLDQHKSRYCFRSQRQKINFIKNRLTSRRTTVCTQLSAFQWFIYYERNIYWVSWDRKAGMVDFTEWAGIS